MTEEENFIQLDKKLNQPIDKNVKAVTDKMISRAEVGLVKYGVTTERTDIDLQGWLTHLHEELMDACIYIERIKKELEK